MFIGGICRISGRAIHCWLFKRIYSFFFLIITILMDVTLYLWLWYCVLHWGALLCCSGFLNNEHTFFDPFFLINEIVSLFGRMGVNYSCLFVSFSSASQCQQYREQASVLENQPTGTFVLQVHAVDADEGANGKVKYGLMHRDSAMPAFRIHPDTGRVHTDCQELSSRDFTVDRQCCIFNSSWLPESSTAARG